MDLEIPESDKLALKRWLDADSSKVDAVLHAIENAVPTLRARDLAREVAAKTAETEESCKALVLAILNLAGAEADVEDDDKSEFRAAVFKAVVGEPVEAATRQAFDTRISRLLSAKSVRIVGKALGVKLADYNQFCTARTISELRPVFRESDLEPEAMIVVHQLRLLFHEGPEGDLNEIVVATDHAGLAELRGVIDRALDKEQKLRTLANRLELPVLEGAAHVTR